MQQQKTTLWSNWAWPWSRESCFNCWQIYNGGLKQYLCHTYNVAQHIISTKNEHTHLLFKMLYYKKLPLKKACQKSHKNPVHIDNACSKFVVCGWTSHRKVCRIWNYVWRVLWDTSTSGVSSCIDWKTGIWWLVSFDTNLIICTLNISYRTDIVQKVFSSLADNKIIGDHPLTHYLTPNTKVLKNLCQKNI